MGKNAYMAPVLASGQSTSILKGPLTGINALRCESASQVHQLVDDIASQLNIPIQRAADYQEYVEAVVACRSDSKKVEAHSSSKEMVDNSASNNSTNDEYANAEEVIKLIVSLNGEMITGCGRIVLISNGMQLSNFAIKRIQVFLPIYLLRLEQKQGRNGLTILK